MYLFDPNLNFRINFGKQRQLPPGEDMYYDFIKVYKQNRHKLLIHNTINISYL